MSKHEDQRKGLYTQGANHRRFGLKPYYTQHKYYSDYMDGYHGRPFRKSKNKKTPAIARMFLWLAALFGA